MSFGCGCGCGAVSDASCGCCDGVQALVPEAHENRPGLSQLSTRIGTHGTFLASLQARLTSHVLAHEVFSAGQPTETVTTRPLAKLTARSDDAVPALLDAWACAADVLTFYQERIANEGYLRTARQGRSLHELASLPGYMPRPGLGSSTCLAFELDPLARAPIVIPAGTRAQSIPGQGQTPQSFETSDDFAASGAWNRLPMRQTRPQDLHDVRDGTLWLEGTATRLKAGLPLLISADGAEPRPFRIVRVEEQPDRQRTRITLERWAKSGQVAMSLLADAPQDTALAEVKATLARVDDDDAAEWARLHASVGELLHRRLSPPSRAWLKQASEVAATKLPAAESPPALVINGVSGGGSSGEDDQDTDLWERLLARPSVPLASAERLSHNARDELSANSGGTFSLLSAANPQLANNLAPALAGVQRADEQPALRVYALRVQAGAFGRNFPRPSGTAQYKPTDSAVITYVAELPDWSIVRPRHSEEESVLHLDGAYDTILPGSWLLLDCAAVSLAHSSVAPTGETIVAQARRVFPKLTRAEYGQSGESTEVEIDRPWLKYGDEDDDSDSPSINHLAMASQPSGDDSFAIVRRTAIYAASEELALAEAPVADPVCDGTQGLALDVLAMGIEPGRLIALRGERADVPGVTGLEGAEIAMIAAVSHSTPDQAVGEVEKGHVTASHSYTTVTLERPLSYCYRRETLQVYGNVVRATQGQTRREPLGNGDATVANQAFALKHAPVTHLPAVNARGSRSTARVYVEDVEWARAESFIDLGPEDRVFVESVLPDGSTAIRFGDGREGARLPSGTLNVAAIYREELGASGNLRAGQIAQLADRPLGVREVVNPVAATGGADPEGPDLVRRNVPIASAALGRLVALSDYADFARGFAGIEKATTTIVPAGGRRLVHLTLGGIDDAPVDLDSELMRTLRRSLRELGDPAVPLQVATRALLPVVIEARVAIAQDRLWERVSSDVRAALARALGYHARDFGQAMAASEIIALIQGVPGVTRVDLDVFGTLPPLSASDVPTPDAIAEGIALLEQVAPVIRPAPARMGPDGTIQPAQLVTLVGSGAQTIALNQQA
ncbi:putative baseplate assembly protein [Novosphingobium sp. 9U]|uniref:putative baseplate assembly protein n=1 Tax=Novosphingobium sp. 9U TaxID=2653158 RepID=UPI0012F1B4C5|nr:putative baseplate assembly protein [Novosphingobium sp. 9U]VWX50893.1 Putative baseplate assembly protein [Novosphingobium sp. 9U]